MLATIARVTRFMTDKVAVGGGYGPSEPPAGFVDRGQVGDDWDTSPFTEASGPMSVSNGTYINAMPRLITAVAHTPS